MQDDQIIVRTTKEYTLEPEIVEAGNNYELLKNRYGDVYSWADKSRKDLQEDWRKRKTDVILRLCHDLVNGELPTFKMPKHIQDILDFLQGNGNTVGADNDAN